MNSKKLLTLLVALCLVIGTLSPAAGAIQLGGENARPGVQQGENASSGKWYNDLIASVGEALGIHTLRDDQSHVVNKDNLSFVNGQWVATSKDGTSVVLKDAQLPEHIRALREAASHYADKDTVYAFVVLEGEPTAELYSSINNVPADVTAALTTQQNALIAQIEQDVLKGESLDVVTQFTYLTNAVVIETAFGNLEPIAALKGVKSVFLNTVYEPAKTSETLYPATDSSAVMSGVGTVWQELGYTGKGMTVAILDTGLDLDHPSFAADPEGASWNLDWLQQKLDTLDLKAEQLYKGTLTAEDLYYSLKVPYAFNYSARNTNVSHNDGLSDHGTHVAGIAAANKVDGVNVVGMAPDAQIVAMKVFNSQTGGSNMYDVIMALEDCMLLEVDVVNMSLGSPCGFSQSGSEEIDAIFERIAETDTILDVAAGNEATSSYGSSYGYYMQTTGNIENSTIASPSTYANAMSIASAENNFVAWETVEAADGTKMFYMQSVEYLYGYIGYSLESLAGQTLEYVIVPGLGEVADFYDADGNSIVEGKIAIITRGTISFYDKAMNAQAAGAVAVMIWNNTEEDIFSFGMTTQGADGIIPDVPVVLISIADGQKLADAEQKTLTVSTTPGFRPDANGGQISSFSSWGVTSDLRLVPDLTGVGGNVYSCYDGGQYGIMSGTSMACPQIAGITVLVKQYLQEKFPEADNDQIRTLIDSLMMSTAVAIIDNDSGVEASPRQQGAGLANALNAITAEAYLSVEGSERPKAELGDSEEGTYSFTFTVNNFSDSVKTYNLRASLLCEDFITDENFPDLYFMAEYDRALDNSAVSFSSESVTVEAGSSVEVTVSIALTEEDKTWIETYFPNGNYIEGFVYLEGEDEVTLSLPFLGFYGQWDDAPIFDTGFWYQNGLWIEGYPEIEMNQYYHILWTSLGTEVEEWLLGFSPYGGISYIFDEEGNPIGVDYSSDNNVISPNGDGVLDQITQFYLSLMRNANWLYLTYTDEAGNVLHYDQLDKIDKTMYISSYGATVPFVYNWYYDNHYDFTDAEGNLLPDGTTVNLTISAVIDYEGAEEQVLATIPMHIDTTAPVLDVENIVESTDENGNYLTLTFAEVHPAYAAVMNASGTQVYSSYTEKEMIDNGDGTYSLMLDVTGLGDEFTVALCDYGCNEAYYELRYTLTDNNPVVDHDALYAYQVFNEYTYAYYGYDYMFGWGTIDKQTAEYQMHLSDAYEYYALVAAEYAGGYVFAVDAGYNFLYMIPGLWNRNQICNLGVNVMDMAFDEVTQTMYLVTKDEDAQSFCLCTIDLLTGELTVLRDYYSKYEMPWAMTFVDGNLYCCKTYYNGFYQINLEDGSYDLSPVVDANGNEFMPTDAAGAYVQPGYSQSMTYSKADGRIYWAYYSMDTDNGAQDLIIIDPATWTSTAVPFYFDQEYVGLLTVEDDGYVLPESPAVTGISLSDEQLILAPGSTYQLSAALTPWNAPVNESVVWTSSNESVATVVDGNVMAVGEGAAVITASYGDVSASCSVNVVDVKGHFYAYNYYSGDGSFGTWIDVSLQDMVLTHLAYSPVDFIAADYNGHDGMIYGFDQFGQCYSYDITTGNCVPLGSGSIVPADMAYDYSSGLMYVIANDQMTGAAMLYNLNMKTGELVEVAMGYDYYLTLACDMYGCLYAANAYGELHMLLVEQGGGGGIGGWEPWSMGEDTTGIIYGEYLMQLPVDSLFYAQSMCYDHVNDVILWTNPETSQVYWVDIWAESPFAIALGDPSGSGLIEYTGMFVVPEVINELPYMPVESVEAEDMVLLEGGAKVPAVSVYPLNATNQGNLTLTPADESIVKVENGMLVGVKAGTTTVTATVNDGDVVLECVFTVSVKQGTDNIYGYLMGDLGTYDGYYWMEIPDADPTNYIPVDYVYYQGAYMTLYAAEHVDGYIYAYGYNANDWNANFQFMVIDKATWSVLSAVDMGDEFPFVYDMAYDYTTGTMYALAGTTAATALYIVNLANGKLIEAATFDLMFMNLAIDGNGTLYMMAPSVEEFDWWTWTSTYTNAILYAYDPISGACEPYMDTGVHSNMLSSMAYDYDTGYIYWSGLFQGASYESGLYLIDLEEMSCNNLGTIGAAGSQVTSLMIFADNYPETSNELQNMILTNSYLEVAQGGTVVAETFLQPAFAEVQMSWKSDDEAIAIVDENGVITGLSAGSTKITVTAVGNGKEISASCTVIVYGENDYFITYNTTDGGFSSIGRPNPTVVNNLTEGEQNAYARAMEMVDGVIYAYDENGNLFMSSADNNFRRTYIGSCGIEVAAPYDEISAGYYTYYYSYTPNFVIRDMAWDPVNNRMLAVGCFGVEKEYYYVRGEMVSETYTDMLEETAGCRLYEVDLATGALTELCIIGGENYEAGIHMLTVTDSGDVYTYSSYMDFTMKLDPNTGAVEYLSTFQNLGMYGSSEGVPMAMTYDPVSGNIYVLFTENGNLYYLYKFNPNTTALNCVGIIGDTYDSFAGLLINKVTERTDAPEIGAESDEHKQNHPDHVFMDIEVEPTCEKWGFTLHVCTAAGCAESYTTDYVPAVGHDHVCEVTYATCTEGGATIATCQDCGQTVVLAQKDALGHDYEVIVTAPTCVEQGYTTYTCRNCGDSYVSDYVDATGEHNYAVETERKDATCTEDGYVIMACACGETERTELISAGHAAGEAVVENEVAASCGTDGSYDSVVYCQVCGAELSSETVVVPATGEHVYATEAERKEATCTEDGYVIMACQCGATETTVLESVGHISGEWVVVKEATETEDGLKQRCCTVCDEVLETLPIPAVEGPADTGDKVAIFAIFTMIAMTGAVVLVSRKKYF